jgi:hypothetical protein
MFGEVVFNVERDMRGFHDSVVGSFRVVLMFDSFGADSFFGEKFDRGEEEVMKEPLLLAIKVIEERHKVGII